MLPVAFVLTDANGRPAKAAHAAIFSVSAPQSCDAAQPSTAAGEKQALFRLFGRFYVDLYKTDKAVTG